MSRDIAFEYLSDGPFCLVGLDSKSGVALKVNNTFEQHMGPQFKFAQFSFAAAAVEGEHREKFESAIECVKSGKTERGVANNVEMISLAGDAGMPIKRHFDWTVGKGQGDDLLLFGFPCSEQTVEQRTKDAELIDFFQNAPIALHWLSGEGIVLWANQTELDVLGYTAEEYIGQPIMKFCPDEEELVLEIFKQLGSGNTIKDVPVRFRTKDGRIVHLLIDSNVKYDSQGNFAHTRCFIRDDTKRKIREERSRTLLEETKRSLKMLDNFMSRSIHHMRTPLHMMQTTCDLVAQTLQKHKPVLDQDVVETLKIVDETSTHMQEACDMADNIRDLSNLDQGGEIEVKKANMNLHEFGKEVLDSILVEKPIDLKLEVDGRGPEVILSDAGLLKRILKLLLNHAVHVTSQGSVKLNILFEDNRCQFAVTDAGPELAPEKINGSSNDLPPIFQKYHQEIIPEDLVDEKEALNLRSKIESEVSSTRTNALGVGLSLSYYLVQALGAELRCSSESGSGNKFWFALPEVIASPEVTATENVRFRSQIALGSTVRMREGNERDIFPKKIARLSIKPEESRKITPQPQESVPQTPKSSIASCGLEAMDTPSILVVEDTALCAKLLCKTLSKLNCSTTWAENGQVALDILKSSPIGRFNLVLMDLRMPVLDGVEATKRIRQELVQDIPVVALTAETSQALEAECMSIGFNDFQRKPMKRNNLKEVILKHTGFKA